MSQAPRSFKPPARFAGLFYMDIDMTLAVKIVLGFLISAIVSVVAGFFISARDAGEKEET